MNEQDFRTAIKETKSFKKKAIFSQKILLKYRLSILYNYFMQAQKYGIDYLKQNPNILISEVTIINEILN